MLAGGNKRSCFSPGDPQAPYLLAYQSISQLPECFSIDNFIMTMYLIVYIY